MSAAEAPKPAKVTHPPKRLPSSEDVRAALRERYAAPEWALFFEVASGTGGAHFRKADAVAMSLWPSRGLEVHGFEVKVRRNDWLREKKTPQKADEIGQFCDRFWLVAPADVVKLEEVPAGWGLLQYHDGALTQKREAPKLDAAPVTRVFLAGLLRAASTQSPADAVVEAAVTRAREEERALAERLHELDLSRAREELEGLQAQVHAFEEASGIHISRYDGGRELGEAVKLVRGSAWRRRRRLVEDFARPLRSVLRECDEMLAIALEAQEEHREGEAPSTIGGPTDAETC